MERSPDDTERPDPREEDWSTQVAAYVETVAPITRNAIGPLLAAASPLGGAALLDVACGPGELLAAAARRGARATGLDRSAPMLAVAARRVPRARLVEGDARALPFADGSFDVVTCAFGLAHLDDPVGCLREIARVLRPGGTLAFAAWLSAGDGFDALDVSLRAVWAHGTGAGSVPCTASPLAERTLARRVLAATGFGVPRFGRLDAVSTHRTAAEAGAVLGHALPALHATIERQPLPARLAIARAIEHDLEQRREGGPRHREGRIVLRWPFAVVSAARRHEAEAARP